MKTQLTDNKQIAYLVIALLAIVIVACVPSTAAPTPDTPTPNENDDVGLANPASVYCEEQGGRVEIRSDAEGNQFGVCVFEDGSECDEWAFFRGECQPGQSETPVADDEPSVADELIGTEWDLVDIEGIAPLPGSKITITFDEGSFNGSAGCNSYFGDFSASGSQIEVGMVGNTEMWCEGLMEQEQAFLSQLMEAVSLTLADERLTIHTTGGDLVFQPAVHQVLEGITWILSGISKDEAVVHTWIDAEINAKFEESQVTGSAGCNQYFAAYEADGQALSLGPVGSTRMACEEERNQRESEFLAALAEVAAYRIHRETLTLTDAEGADLLFFQAQTEPEIPEGLLGQIWYWQEYQDTAGLNDIQVEDPTWYTLELRADGTYYMQVDCNQGSGSYSLDGSSLTFAPGPMTMAACGPDSLDSEFLSKLGDVVTYVLQDGKLYLNLKMDAGNMVFVNAVEGGSLQIEVGFEESDEGWSHGFADLPADADTEFYQLDGGRHELPVGLEGYGYYLQGNNHSDDLFMFIKARIDGLKPNTTYDVNFEIILATAVPEGLMGIGGSPGESVYVKAGAVSFEPEALIDSSDFWRMNVDHGQQAQGGPDMAVLGNIAYHPENATLDGEWQLKSLVSEDQPSSTTTDGNGSLWVIVGIDSGFEGLTNIYFDTINITLGQAN